MNRARTPLALASRAFRQQPTYTQAIGRRTMAGVSEDASPEHKTAPAPPSGGPNFVLIGGVALVLGGLGYFYVNQTSKVSKGEVYNPADSKHDDRYKQKGIEGKAEAMGKKAY